LLLTGELLDRLLAAPQGRIPQSIQANKGDAEIVTDLYLSALCREPRPREMEIALRRMRSYSDRAAGFRALCWALVNSSEFLFQH
jgi:hypothetical protein